MKSSAAKWLVTYGYPWFRAALGDAFGVRRPFSSAPTEALGPARSAPKPTESGNTRAKPRFSLVDRDDRDPGNLTRQDGSPIRFRAPSIFGPIIASSAAKWLVLLR